MRAAGTRTQPLSCPETEVLADTFLGSARLDVRQQVADHLAECADCAEVMLRLEALRSWSPEEDAIVAADELAPAGAPAGRSSILLLAAAVLLTVGAGLLWRDLSPSRKHQEPTARSVLRGGATEDPLRVADLKSPLPPPDLVLAHVRPLPSAVVSSFRVELFDRASNVVWQSEQRGSLSGSHDDDSSEWRTVPPAVLGQLVEGETYFFRYLWFEGSFERVSPLLPAAVGPPGESPHR